MIGGGIPPDPAVEPVDVVLGRTVERRPRGERSPWVGGSRDLHAADGVLHRGHLEPAGNLVHARRQTEIAPGDRIASCDRCGVRHARDPVRAVIETPLRRTGEVARGYTGDEPVPTFAEWAGRLVRRLYAVDVEKVVPVELVLGHVDLVCKAVLDVCGFI